MRVATSPPRPAGPVPSRMPRSRLLWIFTGALAGILAMSVIAILIRHPQAPAPNPCTPPGPCGNPPRGGPTPTPTSPPREPPPSDTSAPLLNGRIWPSATLGFQFEYDDRFWSLADQGPRFVKLALNAPVDVTFWAEAVPFGEANAQQLFDRRIGDLGRDILGLKLDGDPARHVLAPGVGYRPGIGGLYAGAIDTPQGPGDPVVVLVMAATDGRISATISMVMPKFRDPGNETFLFQEADRMLNSFLWPTDPR